MGESDSTVSQPPKPVCDWSLGPVGGEVKGIFPNFFPLFKRFQLNHLRVILFFAETVENRSRRAERARRNGASG